jgi:methionine salvage enolase-phosphatase E1
MYLYSLQIEGDSKKKSCQMVSFGMLRLLTYSRNEIATFSFCSALQRRKRWQKTNIKVYSQEVDSQCDSV